MKKSKFFILGLVVSLLAGSGFPDVGEPGFPFRKEGT